MTDIEALDRLIDGVLAGETPSAHAMRFDIGGQIGDWRKTIIGAYNGSLDAAMALHEALLPGWIAVIGIPFGIITIGPDGSSNRDVRQTIINQPARAWLLAILKAHRAELAAKAGAA